MTSENNKQQLIIDAETGTVLNVETCYVINADQLTDDDFTDREISELAYSVGVRVVELLNKGGAQ